MNAWEILGLAPTADISAIKRAYAGKTKLYHPEDDPQGFQRLREAYEFALKQAKYMQNMELADHEAHETLNIIDEKENLPAAEVIGEPEHRLATNFLIDNTVEQFMNRAKELYGNEILREDIHQWKELLEDDTYWNLDIKQKLDYNMLHFLLDQYQTTPYRLPPIVWKLFDQHFFWTAQHRRLYASFPEEFVDFVMERIHYKEITLRQRFIHKAKKYAHAFYIIFLIITLLVICVGIYSVVHSGAIVMFLIILLSKILRGSY